MNLAGEQAKRALKILARKSDKLIRSEGTRNSVVLTTFRTRKIEMNNTKSSYPLLPFLRKYYAHYCDYNCGLLSLPR